MTTYGESVAKGRGLVKGHFKVYNLQRMLLFDDRYFSKVLEILRQANSSIVMAQFKIDSAGIAGLGKVSQLLLTIVGKAQEGKEVKILLDCIRPLRGRAANNDFIAKWLIKRRVDVRYMGGNRCQHAKIIVVDGAHAIFGSHNWSVSSLSRNAEASIYLTTDAEVQLLEDRCRVMFEAGSAFV